MPFKAFEDLPVWRASIELAVRVFEWTSRERLRGHLGLRDQIERAVVSISNNIAEGYERGTMAELLTFLYIARGSAGEVRSMLAFLGKAEEWSTDRETIDGLRELNLSVSRQLGAWIESLKNSDAPGQRYQNERTRQVGRDRQRREAFLEKLQDLQKPARPHPGARGD